MSLFSWKKTEARAISYQDVFGSGGSLEAFTDTAEAALTLIPVYGATALIADQLCSAPWASYTDLAGTPSKAKRQPVMLTDPHPYGLDLFSWKHQMLSSLLLWGNAYGFVVDYDNRGMPAHIVWLKPSGMNVDETGGPATYRYNGELVPRERMVHIPLYVLPGSVKGLSPIALFRTQMETGQESQRVARNFYKRGAVPSAVLKNTARILTAEQSRTVKEQFVRSVTSSEPFVSGSDWDYKSLGLPQSDVSFLSGIKATATQVAAIYRVPPEDIGGETGGGSLTYKNLEQDMIRFNQRTLRPIAIRVEAAFNRILQGTGRADYLRFNLDAGARADLKTRYEAHAIGLSSGFLMVDEVRALEERPALTDEQKAEIKANKPAPVAPAAAPTNDNGGNEDE